MPTTTNYGWTTPADTDLVKDGASAIRTLGTAIDTTVFNNASAAIAKTIVDAKGDIIAATAADTVSRLAVGANDTVLTADSSTATGLKWAAVPSGSLTLLSTTTCSGTFTEVTSISQSYTDLYVTVENVTWNTSAASGQVRTNLTTSASYKIWLDASMTTTSDATYIGVLNDGANAWSRTGALNLTTLYIQNYASTTSYKNFTCCATYLADGGTSDRIGLAIGGFGSSTAIDSFRFDLDGGQTMTAGTIKVYGVK